jgi:hypothetical protein
MSRPDRSAVSWGAILAGGVGAAALSLIMLILGTGLGLSSVSPWANRGVTATTFGISSILWITFTQFVAAGMGGYLTGRLRTRWTDVHRDEAYFRDSAHGFLAWAVASLGTAALLSSVAGSIVSGGVSAVTATAGSAATVAAGATAAAAGQAGAAMSSTNETGPTGYFLDSLFRKNGTTPDGAAATPQSGGAPIGEVSRIFMNSMHAGPLSTDDTHYVGQLVAQRTGLSQQDAEKRVTETYTRLQTKLTAIETAAKDAADKTRKASAYTALWLFISLLIGAFYSSLAATYGGRQREL